MFWLLEVVSIATLNDVVAIGETLLPHPLFHWYEVFATH
jgi:hypothetical protein